MSQKIFSQEVDHRTVNCRHARLREALQFRPVGQSVSLSREIEKMAEPQVVYEAPEKDGLEKNLGLQIFQGFVTCVLTCVSVLMQPL